MIEAGTRVIVDGEPGTVIDHPAAIVRIGLRVCVELDSGLRVMPLTEEVEVAE